MDVPPETGSPMPRFPSGRAMLWSGSVCLAMLAAGLTSCLHVLDDTLHQWKDDDELTERVEDPLLEARQLDLRHHPGAQTASWARFGSFGSSTDPTTRRALKDTSSMMGRQHQAKPSWRPASIYSSFRSWALDL